MSEQVQIAIIGLITTLLTLASGIVLTIINNKANRIITKADETVTKTNEIHTKVDGNLSKMQAQIDTQNELIKGLIDKVTPSSMNPSNQSPR